MVKATSKNATSYCVIHLITRLACQLVIHVNLMLKSQYKNSNLREPDTLAKQRSEE
jgi:hypothetical protein